MYMYRERAELHIYIYIYIYVYVYHIYMISGAPPAARRGWAREAARRPQCLRVGDRPLRRRRAPCRRGHMLVLDDNSDNS